jgi:hypothetical protein
MSETSTNCKRLFVYHAPTAEEVVIRFKRSPYHRLTLAEQDLAAKTKGPHSMSGDSSVMHYSASRPRSCRRMLRSLSVASLPTSSRRTHHRS